MVVLILLFLPDKNHGPGVSIPWIILSLNSCLISCLYLIDTGEWAWYNDLKWVEDNDLKRAWDNDLKWFWDNDLMWAWDNDLKWEWFNVR